MIERWNAYRVAEELGAESVAVVRLGADLKERVKAWAELAGLPCGHPAPWFSNLSETAVSCAACLTRSLAYERWVASQVCAVCGRATAVGELVTLPCGPSLLLVARLCVSCMESQIVGMDIDEEWRES